MRGKGLAVTLYAWRRRTDLIGRATDRVDLTWSPRLREWPLLYRFLDAGDTETFRMRGRPASKKRRGTESREVGHRRSSEC
jgi:hypothetical protein